jgi:hypothetical protein
MLWATCWSGMNGVLLIEVERCRNSFIIEIVVKIIIAPNILRPSERILRDDDRVPRLFCKIKCWHWIPHPLYRLMSVVVPNIQSLPLHPRLRCILIEVILLVFVIGGEIDYRLWLTDWTPIVPRGLMLKQAHHLVWGCTWRGLFA